jgi:hypothetical protein
LQISTTTFIIFISSMERRMLRTWLVIGLMITVKGVFARRDEHKVPTVRSTHTHEDSRFLVIQNIDNFFLFSINTFFNETTNVVFWIIDAPITLLNSLIANIAAVVGILIKHPTYIVNQILPGIAWITYVFQFLLLDVCLHGIVERGIPSLLCIISNIIKFVIWIPLAGIATIFHFLRIIIVGYINICSLVLVYFIYPCLAVMLMALACVVLAMAFWWMGNKYNAILSEIDIDFKLLCMIILLMSIFTLRVWIILHSFLLIYILYPVTTVLYAITVCFGTFKLIKYLLPNLNYQRLYGIRIEDSISSLQETTRKYFLYAKSKLYDSNKFTHVKKQVISSGQSNDSNKSECIICCEERHLVTLLPCGHVILCQQCASTLFRHDPRCPMDRTPITRCLSISAVSLQNSLYRRFLCFGNGYSLLKTMEGEPMSNIPGPYNTNIR